MANHRSHAKFITKLRALLDKHLGDEQFGVSELAKEAGISRSNLHRKVHAYNGNSTTQFIREFRLQKAIELLLNEDLTVAEIAYQVGFSSPTYFNTCFKEYYGYPPGETKVRAENLSERTEVSENVTITKKKDFIFSKFWFVRKWAVILSVGIGVLISWATIYYLGINKGAKVTNTVNPAAENSIAVLPFINLSGNPDLEYRSDGMTDNVITRLTFVEKIRVIPFNSVLKYKSSDKDAPTIAKELGVQYILQGNYRPSGDVIKFTLHLIHGPSDTNVSVKEYTGAWNENIFSMQATVVEDLLSQLNISINNEELSDIERIPTQNREAYNNWLKARYQSMKFTKTGMSNAISLLEEAIRLDSTFIEPYIDLADIYKYSGTSWGFYTEREAWQRSKELLLKVLEIDPSYSDSRSILNDGLYLYEWDFETMEKNYLTDSDITIMYCLQSGRYEEALALIEDLHLENPVSQFLVTSKAMALYFLDRKEEALTLLKKSDKLYSDHIMYLRIASSVYFYMKEYESSYALLNKFIHSYPERPPTVLWKLAGCEYHKGEINAADTYLAEINNKYQQGSSGSPAWFTALYYASIGNHEKAFEWLQKSYDRHEVEMIWLRAEPVLKPLRTDPRYSELYYKVGFPMPPHNT